MALKRIDITKSGLEWVAKADGAVVARSPKKDQLVRETAASARASGEGTTVRIHKQNGQIQEERTYGKGADPRRSRG